MRFFVLILPVIFKAVSDGLYLYGEMPYKLISKQVHLLGVASWMLIIWMEYKGKFTGKFIKIPVIYVLLRFVFFNYIINVTAWPVIEAHLFQLNGTHPAFWQVITYLGTVSILDRIMTLMSMGQFWFILLLQATCLLFVYKLSFNK